MPKEMTSMRLQGRTKRLLKEHADLFGSQAEATQLGTDILDLIVDTMENHGEEINRTSVILFTMKAMNGQKQTEDNLE